MENLFFFYLLALLIGKEVGKEYGSRDAQENWGAETDQELDWFYMCTYQRERTKTFKAWEFIEAGCKQKLN